MNNETQQIVPVFTIKLYRSVGETERMNMFIAHRLELERRDDSVIVIIQDETGKEKERHQISLHGPYGWGVIENPSGRTTEVLRPRSSKVILHG